MDLVKVKSIIEPVINELGYELYSLNIKHELGDLILDVVVDRVAPINMDDIVSVTDKINEVLDETDPISEEYMLSISSLGAEKPLKVNDLHKYVGEYIHLHLTNPINGENIYEGEIKEVNEDSLTLTYRIKTRSKNIDVNFSNIYKVRLAIKF